ncbi:MAG: helix-turn-helix domain-containing protein [Bacteroidales bacterium]|nr:helix-turn-helix domain-containing protein [Bacteroidales bacterium]
MQQPQEFSAQTIKKNVASLPDTYYGEECNVSLKSGSITIKSASDGEPLRFDNLGISFCRSGHISSEINLSPQTVGAGDFELIFPGSIYRLKEISGDCELVGIAISPFLVDGILPDTDKTFFSRVGTNIRVRLDENEQLIFTQMAEVYLHTLQLYGETSEISREMTVCVMQFAFQVCSPDRVEKVESGSRADELCTKFITLLSRMKGTRRTIGWFAEELCVSNHYLSMAVKESSGQSVKSLIDNSVIMEIKVLLRHSDLSVSQIADRLEFPNSSFLCKFFKAKTGVTPLHYKRRA